jgi:hypothetical protein
MGVEGDAFSPQSKTMPNASQLMQTILNSGFGMGVRSSRAFMLVILCSRKQNRVAEYDAGEFAVVGPDGTTMSGPIMLSLLHEAAT